MSKNNVVNADFTKKTALEADALDKKNTPTPPTVIYLGIAMFLMNLSFLMIFSLFPAYLMTLGYSQTSLGILEGIFEFISQILKFSSGFISDILRRRQLLVLLGCGVIFAGRTMIAFSSHFFYLIFGRSIDRIGNGIYAIPRDALVAAASPKEKRAQSLGLVRSLGQLGSFSGAIIASFLMKYMGFGFKDVFAFAAIPTFLIVLIVMFKVKEVPFEKAKSEKRFQFAELRKTGASFFLLMIVNFIFMLGRCNEAFMGPYAMRTFGMAVENVPYVMIVFNISWAAFSYPVGIISDRFGRFRVLTLGIIAMIIADMFFFNASSLSMFFIGVIFWGIQMGITTNTFTSLIVDTVSTNLRGTAFGVYFLINAVALFIADSTGGYIADIYGTHAYMYLVSACWGVLALVALMIIMKCRDLTHQHE